MKVTSEQLLEEQMLKRPGSVHQRPVFVHGMFRTGGTYVWSKFRKLGSYRAYYEPLNEVLAKPEEEVRIRNREFAARARHPESDFYFAELPFEPGRGVEYFDKSFGFEPYALAEHALHEPLRRYFANLLTYALAHRQIPLFKVDRGLLRTGWLTANFFPLNLLVLRKPFDVWQSYKSFGEQHIYHKVVTCIILGRNRDHAILGDLADRYKLPESRHLRADRVYEFYAGWVREAGDALYPLFFELYLLTTLHSARYADCILDMTGISSNPELKAAATRRLSELGIPISLEDCRMPSRAQNEEVRRRVQEIEQSCRERLQGHLPEQFLVPEERLELLRDSVGDYFCKILNSFRTTGQSLDAARSQEFDPGLKNQEAVRLIREGRAVEGAELLGKVLRHGQTPELWNVWAKAQASSGHFVSAAAGFRRSLELKPRAWIGIRYLSVVLKERCLELGWTILSKSILAARRLKRTLRRLIIPRWTRPTPGESCESSQAS